jgi:Flp pilus assembly pilin Flp
MRFFNDESGQDLMEYSLLITFLVLASALLFISFGGSAAGIWGSANIQLVSANAAAS